MAIVWSQQFEFGNAGEQNPNWTGKQIQYAIQQKKKILNAYKQKIQYLSQQN